jgi:biopolymer transport protein TolQ
MTDWTGNVAQLILHAGPLAKVVLIILLLFSIASWSVVLDRWRYFRHAGRHISRFRDLFNTSGLVNLNAVLKQLRGGPLSRMAEAAMEEYELSFRRRANPGPALEPMAQVGPGEESRRQALLGNVERALTTAMEEELALAERRLPFLATTASVGPLLGLFGTVWGIMGSFMAIGAGGSANIQAVGPGIAEALIVTAAGLAAAIPAAVGYNHYLGRTRILSEELGAFARELQSAFAREAMR